MFLHANPFHERFGRLHGPEQEGQDCSALSTALAERIPLERGMALASNSNAITATHAHGPLAMGTSFNSFPARVYVHRLFNHI